MGSSLESDLLWINVHHSWCSSVFILIVWTQAHNLPPPRIIDLFDCGGPLFPIAIIVLSSAIHSHPLAYLLMRRVACMAQKSGGGRGTDLSFYCTAAIYRLTGKTAEPEATALFKCTHEMKRVCWRDWSDEIIASYFSMSTLFELIKKNNPPKIAVVNYFRFIIPWNSMHLNAAVSPNQNDQLPNVDLILVPLQHHQTCSFFRHSLIYLYLNTPADPQLDLCHFENVFLLVCRLGRRAIKWEIIEMGKHFPSASL